MKRLLLLVFITCFFFLPGKTQLLSWTPAFAKESDNLVITLDATRGNAGLLNYAGNVYVHIGLITSKSNNGDDWKYVLFDWGTSPAAGRATLVATNKWTYTVTNIRNFFNVTDPTETIEAIAILFRSADGNTVQRNADGSNMYVPVYTNDLAIRIVEPPFQPKLIREPESLTKALNDNLVVTALSNKAASLSIYVNGSLAQSVTGATTITENIALTTAGNNTIITEANDGTTIVKDSVKFFVSGGVTVAPLPDGAKPGINYRSDNTSVILVLEAPGKNRVAVIGEFPGNNWTEQSAYQMNKTPDGKYWWLQINGLTQGVEYAYQYLVDGSLKIADPYAEKILDPWNDPYITPATYPSLKPYPAGQSGIVSVLQTNQTGYNWTNTNFQRPDRRSLVIYELLVRDFVAAHDWKTLKDTIGYLKRLGINAIELLPFNEFEGNESWGYNPDFYFAPDKYYGPKNSLKEFIDVCHSNGISVIMDIALNHSFGLSPMVQLYWDAANNRPAANNPWFNPVTKHAFNVGYDMNHESAASNYFFSRVVEHWLKEYKIDGFRFDLSKGFTQKATCDANGGNCDVNGWSAYDASRIAIWKKYYDTLQLKSAGSYVILEHLGVNTEEKELSDYGMLFWGNMNHSFSEAAMGWLDNSNFEGALHTARGWTNPYLVAYMESHDEERMTYKSINFGNSSGTYSIKDTTTALKRNELCAAFFMAMPGPKMIWQFGELGYDYPINYCPNGTVNEDCRTSNKPIRWDYRQQARRVSLYNMYSKLAALRHHGWYKDIFIGNGITLDKNFAGAFKWMTIRSATDSSLLYVVGNFGVTTQSVTITYPKTGVWYDYFGNSATDITSASQLLTLQPGEYKIFLNRNLTGAEEPIVEPPPPPPVDPAESLEVLVTPNPVSGASVIRINVPKASRVEMVVYNSSGKAVSRVYNGVLVPGEQQLPWIGGPLPAGVYILHVKTLEEKKTVKLIVP